MRLVSLAALVAALAVPSAQACYTVYDAANRVVYQSMAAPVDMSQPLHDTVPRRFPGGFLVFEEGSACPVVPSLAMGQGGIATRSTSPLLTEERNARAMGAPHQSLGHGVAVVAPGQVEVTPTVNVVPHGRRSVAALGPAVQDTQITELKDPPGATIERSVVTRRARRPATTVLGGPSAPERDAASRAPLAGR
ncbi:MULTISPECIES: hypothetical protein [Ramlibacter]|uniref:DUF4124 domain-containing protein n=1 Tax=Ramlibacter aquaticus TaxID=2780094 RepID=A0ABR9SDA3_9BURK|nr:MULTISPECIES: hypothetical protein [Ramlibacter]MBE7940330.1 hypothetical protein [Ramlibacter aquaticus]